MGLAMNMGGVLGCALPTGKCAEDVYRDVVKLAPDLTNKDFSSVYKYLSTMPRSDGE